MSIRSIISRALFVFSLSLVVMGLTVPMAFATAEPADAEEAPTTTAIPADVVVPEPAIPIVDDAPAETEPEWTFRFLVPTALALGTLAVVGTILAYFVKVTKARYRVVE